MISNVSYIDFYIQLAKSFFSCGIDDGMQRLKTEFVMHIEKHTDKEYKRG